MIPFTPFRQRELAFRRLLCLLGKPIRQDDQPPGTPKPQQPKGVAAKLGPHFPQIRRPFQLLEILLRNLRQFPNGTQYPQNLLRLLGIQAIEKFLHRAAT